MTNINDVRDVAVIGGGLAGLATAAYTARAGLDTVVLERRSEPGGRASTHHRGDFALNRGAHALYRRGEAVSVLADLRVDYSGMPPQGRMLALSGDRLATLPTTFRSLVLSRLLGAPAKWQVARLLATLPSLDREPMRGVSAEAWVDQTLSAPEARSLLKAFIRLSSYVGRLDDLDAATAIGQIVKGGGGVLYVDDGWGTLVNGLADRVRAEGGAVRVGARATSLLTTQRGTFRVGVRDGYVEARRIVIATSKLDATTLLDSMGLSHGSSDAPRAKAMVLDVALDRLPRPDAPFVLGIDRPLYLSVHSTAARLAPPGGAVVHLVRYHEHDAEDPDRGLAELEALLDRAQPGWRGLTVERQFFPSLTVASHLDLATERGSEGRAAPEVIPGLFVVGDWVQGGSWLSDASLGSARIVARRLVNAAERVAA